MKIAKRLISVLLILILLSNVGVAEETRDFTADEQAYNAYLDITNAYAESVKYLKEFRELWSTYLELESVIDMDEYWFEYTFLARTGSLNDENVSRIACFLPLAEYKYGLADITELYDSFMTLVSAHGNKMTSVVSAGLALAQESHYIKTQEDIQSYLDNAMSGIRTLMALDREYPFLKDLQEYYKEAVLVSEYIEGSSDNYVEFEEVVDTYSEALRSWEIDFEFIFDPDGYSYVHECRTAQQESKWKTIYDQAAALEANGDYESAIELYWECKWYEDSLEKIRTIQVAKTSAALHEQYTTAVSYQEAGDYESAIDLFYTLMEYKDSAERYAICVQSTKNEPVKSKEYIRKYVTYDMPAGTSETEIYKYSDSGTLVCVELSGVRYGHKFSDTTTYQYDKNGIITTSEQVYITTGTETVYHQQYDAHGNIVESTRISYNGDTSKPLTTSYSYTYDKDGNILTKTTSAGSISNANSYVYEYDQVGNIVRKEVYRSKELVEATEYIYNIYGRVEKAIISYSAKDTTNIVEVLYSY